MLGGFSDSGGFSYLVETIHQKMYQRILCCAISLLLVLPLDGQEAVKLVPGTQILPLNPYLQVWRDSTHEQSFQSVRELTPAVFRPYSQLSQPLSPAYTYWVKVALKSTSPDSTDWMVNTYNNGLVSYFIEGESGSIRTVTTGRYVPAAQKAPTDHHQAHAPFTLPPGKTLTLWVRIQEIDHTAPKIELVLYDRLYWEGLNLDLREPIVLFFLGIFFIMSLYNLVLYFSTRFPAYWYYALYLISVATFVAYVVGPMQSPPWGDPRHHQHLAYLAFGLINIFYFLFGKSFLDTATLIPRWDRWIVPYIGVKLVILVGVQVLIALTFDLNAAVQVEFLLFFLDVVLTLILFVVLLRTRSRLAYFFVAGSASVITLGLSLAVIGHVFEYRYTFLIFLSTIVVEIIFFSLGLGYRMRESERQKLAAEKEKRAAQEALNRELSKINTAFGRFVPHEFIHSLGHESVLEVSLGEGVEREVTVFFVDIRGYTSLSENMTPQENFHFLNEYLGRVGPIIQRHGGFVNQYYGDGIMALFTEKPLRALEAAMEMQEAVCTFNAERGTQGLSPLHIGIGLHRGPLMMGIIGDTLRMDAGVVSDTVNTAARMEGLTKYFSVQILLSETVLEEIPDKASLPLRFLGKVQVKGKAKALGVFDCYGADPDGRKLLKAQLAPVFNEGMEAYLSQNFARAAQLFEEVLKKMPQDKTTRRYLDNTRQYLLQGVPEGWNGVENMVHK